MNVGAWVFTSPGSSIALGPITLRWYGLLIATALFLGINLSQYLAARRGLNPDWVVNLTYWMVVPALIGARLYYVAFEWGRYQTNPWAILAIWQGGIAIHGAILGGLLGAWLFTRRQRLYLWAWTDIVVPSLALGQALGRWGNFFNSEAFGTPTDLPWKLYIPPAHRPAAFAQQAYFHPTFLYESLWNLGVLGLLLTVFWRFPKAKPGTLTCLYLVAYSLGRVWIEGLRTDSLMLGPLRIAQVISLVGLSLGTLGLVCLYRFNRPLPGQVKPAGRGEHLG